MIVTTMMMRERWRVLIAMTRSFVTRARGDTSHSEQADLALID